MELYKTMDSLHGSELHGMALEILVYFETSIQDVDICLRVRSLCQIFMLDSARHSILKGKCDS